MAVSFLKRSQPIWRRLRAIFTLIADGASTEGAVSIRHPVDRAFKVKARKQMQRIVRSQRPEVTFTPRVDIIDQFVG
jgi:hypothetical protein